MKKKNIRKNIPKLSETFKKYNSEIKGELSWYMITMADNFATENLEFKNKFIKIQNQKGQYIYFIGKEIEKIQYNIVYIGKLERIKNKTDKSLNLVFFVTIIENDSENFQLSRKFFKLFNNMLGSKLLKKNKYNVKSYTFKNEILYDRDQFRNKLFLYFKENINFSSKISNESKILINKNLVNFVEWSTNKVGINENQMYEYLNNIKYMKKNTFSKKWYIEFILLFQISGAKYYSKNKKNMFKNIPYHMIDDEKRISDTIKNNLKIESFKNLKEKRMGADNNIFIYFSETIIKKNLDIKHIFIDGSSIGDEYNSIIIMTLRGGIYQCLFFIKYKKYKIIVKKHFEECKKKTITRITCLCTCEWFYILKNTIGGMNKINSATIDFEPSLVAATNKLKFKIYGCYFHYLQNLFKKTIDLKASKILTSISEMLPFVRIEIRESIITRLKNIKTNKYPENSNYRQGDRILVKYLEKTFQTAKINKFNYFTTDKSSFFKLTNNCCERFFQYLKDLFAKKYTFKDAILTRVYFDLINFYKIQKSGLEIKNKNAKNRIDDCVDAYIRASTEGKILEGSKKKKKMDKNFDKSSKKTKVSKFKENIIIESESEFEENTINKKNNTKSIECPRNTFNKNKTYSEPYKKGCIKYIQNNLFYNIKTADLLKKNEEDIKKRDKIIKKKDNKIDEKDKIIKEKDKIIKKKDDKIDKIIEEKDKVIKKKDAQIQEKDKELRENIKKMDHLRSLIAGLKNDNKSESPSLKKLKTE